MGKRKWQKKEKEVVLNSPDVGNFSDFFKNSSQFASSITDTIADVYAWSSGLEPSADNLPLPFVSKDDEVVWSYLKHQNKQLETMHKKYRGFLNELSGLDQIEIETVEEDEDDEDLDDEEIFDEEEEFGDDEEEEEEEEVDLFNLKPEDLKNLDEQLKAMESDEDDEEGGEKIENKTKKAKKSVVDDAFFNLEEMHDYLEKTEKHQVEGGEKSGEESMMFEDDDKWDGNTTYTYEDFFGSREDVEENGEKKGKKRKVVMEKETEDENKQKKRVRFAMDEEEEEEEEEMEDEEGEDEENQEQPVLLGADLEEEKEESGFAKRQKRMKEKIAKLEAENLKPRSWELSGEVAGEQREKNTLLEQHVEFDHGTKRAPEVTEEFTDKLEALIIQRIKDKAFDDVVRVKKIEQKGPKFETEALENIHNKKVALADVYEKEYQASTGTENGEKSVVNEAHEEIKKKMGDLFQLIDALTHFEYKPATAKEDIKIVSNMASLRVEEVGAMASSEGQLIAPEEVAKKMRGIVKGEEERDRTDKLRERRKKKAKQRALVEKLGEERVFGEQKAAKRLKLKKGENEKQGEKIKSSNFFSKLQDTVQQEKSGKTTKKKLIKREKTDKNSAAIKL